jgi:hypothetical protein
MHDSHLYPDLLPFSAQVKCQFGAIVSGPGDVAVNAIAVMADDRKSKAKNSVHLELREDFYKPMALGSCVRIQETRGVRDAQSGADIHDLLAITGDTIPEDGLEVCKSRKWSFIGRVGPLESYEGQGCQSVTYKSTVTAIPSSGYQGTLHSDGVVKVRTQSCRQDDGDGNEDPQQTYKGNDYYSKQPGSPASGHGQHSEGDYTYGHEVGGWDGFFEDDQHASDGQHQHHNMPGPGSNKPHPGGTPKGPTWSPHPGSNPHAPGGGGSNYGSDPASGGGTDIDDDDNDGEGGYAGMGSDNRPVVPGPGGSSNEPPSYSAPGSSGGSKEPLGSDGSGTGEYVSGGGGGPSKPGDDDNSGEGYEDHQHVDFWKKGSQPKPKETPSFGVEEKLATSSTKAKASTQQSMKASTHQAKKAQAVAQAVARRIKLA